MMLGGSGSETSSLEPGGGRWLRRKSGWICSYALSHSGQRTEDSEGPMVPSSAGKFAESSESEFDSRGAKSRHITQQRRDKDRSEEFETGKLGIIGTTSTYTSVVTSINDLSYIFRLISSNPTPIHIGAPFHPIRPGQYHLSTVAIRSTPRR